MQDWKRTRCTSVHRPIMTAAQTGPTSRNSGLQPNRSSRCSPIRSPQPHLANWPARPRTFRTSLNGRVSVIDRGRIVTVLNQDEAAVLFRIGDGHSEIRIAHRVYRHSGVKRWPRRLRRTRHLSPVHGREMQHALRFLQRLANPAPTPAGRGGR